MCTLLGMRCSHRTLCIAAAVVWCLVGLFLFRKGIYLLTLSSSAESILLLLVVGLLLGYLKGKVLGRAARRNRTRILNLPEPQPFWRLFGRRELLLILSMMALGMVMRLLPNDTRGFILVVVGAGLINGAVIAFRMSNEVKDAVGP